MVFDAAGVGREPSGDLSDGGIHVAVDGRLARLGVGLAARHADIEHRGTRLDIFGAHEVLDPRSAATTTSA